MSNIVFLELCVLQLTSVSVRGDSLNIIVFGRH